MIHSYTNLGDSIGYRFDFDRQLPNLSLAFDLKAVAKLFKRRWPRRESTAHPQPSVKNCHLQDIKYQPAKHCVTTYKLSLAQPGANPWQTIGVIKNSPAGLTHSLFDDDPQLPWLTSALNPEAMLERFARSFIPEGTSSQRTETIEACVITPIRYKPGSRCTLHYNLQTTSGQQVFFGKTLARNSDQLMKVTTSLYQTSQVVPAMPRIAQLLTYWPEIRMVVQSAISGGTELNDCAFDTTKDGSIREKWMHAAGIHLAALHTYAQASGPQRNLEDDLGDLGAYHSPISIIAPTLATQFERAIAEIKALAHGQAEPDLVASHGAFRTDQFMIKDDHFVLIDLDSFCWANPARDIGNFLAYLEWKAIRQPHQAAFIQRAQEAFLNGYLSAKPPCGVKGPTLDISWLRGYQAISMLKIIGRRFRNLNYKEWHLTSQLLDATLAILKA